MLAMLGFFALGVVHDMLATMELIFCAEERMKPTILVTLLRSAMAYGLTYWIIQSPDRLNLLVPWVAGDIAGAWLGMKLKKWLDGHERK